MAIPTGSGTEVLKAHSFEDINADNTKLIIGIKFHTYTLLSYISHCTSLGTAATDVGRLQLRCFDAFAGTTDSVVQIATYQIQALETFVWNDRFSFFGGEPANQGIMTDAATQLAIGVQNSNVVQVLEHGATDTAAIYDVHVTFVDQDWT